MKDAFLSSSSSSNENKSWDKPDDEDEVGGGVSECAQSFFFCKTYSLG